MRRGHQPHQPGEVGLRVAPKRVTAFSDVLRVLRQSALHGGRLQGGLSSHGEQSTVLVDALDGLAVELIPEQDSPLALSDPLTVTVPQAEGKRELMLALARARKDHWFVARRRDVAAMAPWLKRAFLAGASCMASDVKEAFFKTEERTGDVLEQAVIRWARAKPLG